MSSSEIISGNRRFLIGSVIIAAIVSVIMYAIEPLLVGVPIVICGTLLLVTMLSQDAARHARPILLAQLSENHREIILENAGTLAADNIQVTAVGVDEPWSIATLEPDTKTKFPLPNMVTLLTCEVTYQAGKGERKSKVFTVGRPETDEDPLRPAFPLFSWKDKE